MKRQSNITFILIIVVLICFSIGSNALSKPIFSILSTLKDDEGDAAFDYIDIISSQIGLDKENNLILTITVKGLIPSKISCNWLIYRWRFDIDLSSSTGYYFAGMGNDYTLEVVYRPEHGWSGWLINEETHQHEFVLDENAIRIEENTIYVVLNNEYLYFLDNKTKWISETLVNIDNIDYTDIGSNTCGIFTINKPKINVKIVFPTPFNALSTYEIIHVNVSLNVDNVKIFYAFKTTVGRFFEVKKWIYIGETKPQNGIAKFKVSLEHIPEGARIAFKAVASINGWKAVDIVGVGNEWIIKGVKIDCGRIKILAPTYFKETAEKYTLCAVLNAMYNIMIDAYGYDPNDGKIQYFTIEKGARGGAWSGNPITISEDAWPSDLTYMWIVYGHELGHNFHGASIKYYQIFGEPGIKEPYTENIASLLGVYALDYIIQHRDRFPEISDLAINSIKKWLKWEYSWPKEEKILNNYLSKGKNYSYISIEVVGAINKYLKNKYGRLTFMKRFFRLFYPPSERYPIKISSEEEQATVWAAMISAAANEDLSDMFKSKWGYPIQSDLFKSYYMLFKNHLDMYFNMSPFNINLMHSLEGNKVIIKMKLDPYVKAEACLELISPSGNKSIFTRYVTYPGILEYSLRLNEYGLWKYKVKISINDLNQKIESEWNYIDYRENVTIKIATEPEGLTILIDGKTYNFSNIFEWEKGSKHIIEIIPYINYSNTRYVFEKWNDNCRDYRRTIMVNDSTTLIAIYHKEYLVTVISKYGEIKGKGWYRKGETVVIQITPTLVKNEAGEFIFQGFEIVSGSAHIIDEKTKDGKIIIKVEGPVTLRAQWMQKQNVNSNLLGIVVVMFIVLMILIIVYKNFILKSKLHKIPKDRHVKSRIIYIF